jgi:hypothetical protein
MVFVLRIVLNFQRAKVNFILNPDLLVMGVSLKLVMQGLNNKSLISSIFRERDFSASIKL